MKNSNIILLIFISCLFFSCNKNDRERILQSTTTISDKIKDISKSTVETITAVKDSITKTFVPKKIKDNKTITKEANSAKDSIEIEKLDNEKLKGFSYFKKLLLTCKTGETLTQKELIEDHNIPKEGVKLIKSITKTAEDEIAIKWKSTWFVEKISDAKFTDARMKIKFEANKMYTSGKAIGIKYNKKIYNDLIIIGNSAYIPSVKGYHWKIGK